MKNVAGVCVASSVRMIAPVYGLGPSSNVSATSGCRGVPEATKPV